MDLTNIDPAAWSAAIVALLTTIFTFFKWLLPFLRTWVKDARRSKNQRLTESGMKKYQDLYLSLQELEHHGVQRTIIFAGHNGGGIPKPGTPFYVSALHWLIDAQDRDSPNKLQNLPVDAAYISMLGDIMDNGTARIHTEDMPPSQLRDIYVAGGVSDSLIVFLGNADNRLYYMSASLFNGSLTEPQVTEIKLQANIVRNLIHG